MEPPVAAVIWEMILPHGRMDGRSLSSTGALRQAWDLYKTSHNLDEVRKSILSNYHMT